MATTKTGAAASAAMMATEEKQRPLNDDELEQNWAAEGIALSDDEDVVSVGSDDEVDDDDEPEVSNKRSRDEEGKAEGGDGAIHERSEAPPKKKQKSSDKPSKGLHKMNANEHFKIVNDLYVKYRGGQLTTLELAEGLNESHFAAPIGLGKHTLQSLSLYMRHLLPSWKSEFKGKGKKNDGSPCFLIICSSALRAVELLKHFGTFHCKVAKLFAKHKKAQDQADQLFLSFHPIAVGTPGRIKKLLEMNALSMKHTTHIIIDMEKDKKSMTILEVKDTAKEMMDLLQFYFIPELKKEKLKLVLY